MKIIHCADLHLDSRMTSNLSPDKAKERKNEILNTFVNMVDYASAHEVDAIIIAGDMFDTSNISALTRNTVERTIRSHKDIEFYYLLGNHDRDNFLSGLDSIPDNLFLFKDSFITYNPKGNQNITITGIELNSENNNGVANGLILSPSRFNIVTMHGQESVSMGRDKTKIVNIRELKNKNIDYLALGHIHYYKEEKLDEGGVYCYSGCLEGRGFDEPGDHGFVLITIDEEKKTSVREFVKFAARDMVILSCDITDCMTTMEVIDRIDDSIAASLVRSRDLVKIVLKGQTDVEAERDVNYIVKHYEDRFYFVKVYDESSLKINIDEYLMDMSLKGEYVRRIMAATDISEEDKKAIVQIGLRAMSGEEI